MTGRNRPENATVGYAGIPFLYVYTYSMFRKGQLKLLAEELRTAQQTVDMTNSTALNTVGYGFYQKKEYATAIRLFRESMYQDPFDAKAHDNLACTLSLLRDYIWANTDPSPETMISYHRSGHFGNP